MIYLRWEGFPPVKRLKSFLPLIVTLLLVISFCLIPMLAFGDAGNFSGGSDYGGSSGGFSGGYSGSSSSSSSYFGGSSSDSDGEFGVLDCIFTIIVAVVIIVIFFWRKKLKSKSDSHVPYGQSPMSAALADKDLEPMDAFLELDPDFSQPAMQEKISNLYVQMQNNWQAKDFTPMRPYFSDALYTQFDRQLDDYRKNKQTNYVDRIAVLSVVLEGWYETDANECIVAQVSTRIIDYVTDDKTGQVISGSNTAEKFMVYEWTMMRTKGVKTQVQKDESEGRTCPNCGAPLNINQSAQCEYCGSTVTSKDFDWVISAIKGISQRTGS